MSELEVNDSSLLDCEELDTNEQIITKRNRGHYIYCCKCLKYRPYNKWLEIPFMLFTYEFFFILQLYPHSQVALLVFHLFSLEEIDDNIQSIKLDLIPIVCFQIYLIYHELKCIVLGFPKRLVFKSLNFGFSCWLTYVFFVVKILIIDLIDYHDTILDKITELAHIVLSVSICLLILGGFVKAIDEDHYELYFSKGARGKSVVIEHIPQMISGPKNKIDLVNDYNPTESLRSSKHRFDSVCSQVSTRKTLL